jgi:hypothetical protein
MPTVTKLDTFTRQYIETALWSTNDESTPSGGEPFDANYGIDDIHPDTLAKMVADCAGFQDSFGELFTDSEELSQAGHDFWLTRNRHGAGFDDGDWPEDIGERLAEASRKFGGQNLYIGDDGMIHGD